MILLILAGLSTHSKRPSESSYEKGGPCVIFLGFVLLPVGRSVGVVFTIERPNLTFCGKRQQCFGSLLAFQCRSRCFFTNPKPLSHQPDLSSCHMSMTSERPHVSLHPIFIALQAILMKTTAQILNALLTLSSAGRRRLQSRPFLLFMVAVLELQSLNGLECRFIHLSFRRLAQGYRKQPIRREY